MSKVVEVCKDRDLGHIVQTAEGVNYYVDSTNSFDCGYETMAFLCDEELGAIDWSGVYTEYHSSYEKMEKRHNYLIEHLEEVLA